MSWSNGNRRSCALKLISDSALIILNIKRVFGLIPVWLYNIYGKKAKKANIVLLCFMKSVYNRNSEVLTTLCKACILVFTPLLGLHGNVLVSGH